MRLTPSAASRLALGAWTLVAMALAALVLAAPGPAAAAPGCTVTVTPSNAFDPPDVLTGGTLNTTATLTFSCVDMIPAVPITLCANLDGGSGGGDGSGGRLLAGPGGAVMSFDVFQDAARTIPWGSSSFLVFGTVPAITMTPGLSGDVSTTRTLYAKITFNSTNAQGSYSSTFENQNFIWGPSLLGCAGIPVGFPAIPAAFSFSAEVQPNCILTLAPLAFGTVGVLSHTVAAENQLSVRCTAGTPWSLGLGNGQDGTGPTARKMSLGAGRVTYGIYKDADHTQPWGELSQGASAVNAGTGTGSAAPVRGYGLVPVQTTPTPGLYGDSVVATLTY